MVEQTDKGNQYTYDGRWKNKQTRAINIPTIVEQTEKGNQYTYDGLTDRLLSSSSLHFWPSFTTEDYWPSAVLNLVNK
jgi:hypothetical protein